MILEAWDIEMERVHSFAIILSDNDTVTFQFPTYGLAVVVKKEFLPLKASLRYASCGRNSFSTTPAKPCVRNWDVPFVTCRGRGIHFLPLMASPLVVGIFPSKRYGKVLYGRVRWSDHYNHAFGLPALPRKAADTRHD